MAVGFEGELAVLKYQLKANHNNLSWRPISERAVLKYQLKANHNGGSHHCAVSKAVLKYQLLIRTVMPHFPSLISFVDLKANYISWPFLFPSLSKFSFRYLSTTKSVPTNNRHIIMHAVIRAVAGAKTKYRTI